MISSIEKTAKYYKERCDEFNKGFETSSNTDIKSRYLHNIFMLHTLMENLNDLLESVRDMLEQKNRAEEESNLNSVNEIIRKSDEVIEKLKNPEELSEHENELLLMEVSNALNRMEAAEIDSKFREILTETIKISTLQSINAANVILRSRSVDEEKKALLILVKFIATLNPFISGADSIYQIIRGRELEIQQAETFLGQLKAYGAICFSHAVSTKYLNEAFQNIRNNEHDVINIDDCIDKVKNTYKEQIQSYKNEKHN